MRAFSKHGGLILLLSLLLLFLGFSGALAESGQIDGLVWLDKNADGLITSGEGGLAGARVTLEIKAADGSAQVAVNAMASDTGNFLFSSLAPGEYRVRVDVGKDYKITLPGQDSALLPGQDNVSYTPWFTLGENEKRTVNAGATKNGVTVSMIVFEDENANGGRMQGEALLRGVSVQVIYEYQGETYIVASDATDKNGQVTFRNLSPAAYRVQVLFPEHYTAGPMGQKMTSFYNCVLAETEDAGLTEPFTLAAKESIGLGAGLVRTGSLAGKAWFDANYNGKWDADETGLTGAEVTLFSADGSLKRTSQPDETGLFGFRALQPGDYLVRITLPEGMIFTYPGQSKLTDTASKGTLNVYVEVNQTADLGVIGAMPAAGFSLTLYSDDNLNGLRDGGEALLSGAAVTAAQGGKIVEKAVTDENGTAAFNALRGGDTQIEVTLPEGWLLRADQGGLFTVAGTQTTASAALFLDGAEAAPAYEAAVITASAVTGLVFEDGDNSGLLRADSLPLAGFTVQAVASDGTVAAQAETDENGAYTLYPLPADDYTVRFLLRDAYVASPYAADAAETGSSVRTRTPEYGETDAFFLAPGERKTGLNAGAFQAGVAEGYVLADEAYAPAGTGLPGVTVTLVDAQGNMAADHSYCVTDENGYFFIKGILPGAYSLAYELPENGVFVDPAAAGKRWVSEPFQTGSGSHVEAAPVKGMLTSTLAGFILHDAPQEAGLENALLSLRGGAANQAYQIHAAADGSFAFSGLLPDTYVLTVTLPDGLAVGSLSGSPFNPDRDGRASAEFTLTLGEDRLDILIQAVNPVTLSGVLFYDDDLSGLLDGEEYGMETRSLTLWENGDMIEACDTDSEGGFVFDRLIPGAYELRIMLDENEELLGQSGVTRHADEAALTVDVPADTALALPVLRYASVSGQVWTLGGGEGVGGVAVTLLDDQGAAVGEAVSDENGFYEFNRLMPGDYALSAVLPQGYLFARILDASVRESCIQSQVDGTLISLPFFVPMGDDLSGIDVGVGAMGRLGDRAWLDENGNGMQDMDEPSMPGILIELYQYGELIASTETDVYGRYSLNDLYPGEYEMRVTMHKELKATVHQTEFPLVGSVLPEEDGLTVTVPSVTVPSGKANMHCDLGFQLRKQGVYPEAMDLIPAKDWRPYSER